jgi:Topoisomerase DNA binding C4 zinc finger
VNINEHIDNQKRIEERRLRDEAATIILRNWNYQTEKESILAINRNIIQDHQICNKCQVGVMHLRYGVYGSFLGCNRFPDCKNWKEIG